jgi:cobalt-precorrin-5B (C1)-methyltransferase
LVSKSRRLRTGYTTGACAAAAAKAATLVLFKGSDGKIPKEVEIPFPYGGRHAFRIRDAGLMIQDKKAWASVVKDAGDDPDITNGAEIIAEVGLIEQSLRRADADAWEVMIQGGKGVGRVTRPGLPVPVGRPAINPVPRKMIREAVYEAVRGHDSAQEQGLLAVTISVPGGETIAKKTLNHRLGIVGGISILGTTGIVKPVSAEAWTATITASMGVAKAMGHEEIVLSAGRSSEKAHQEKFRFPEEMYVMMGDYLEYSLLEAKKHGFGKVHLSAQWAKMLKIAMSVPQTHVRHGSLDTVKAVEFLHNLGKAGKGEGRCPIPGGVAFNTAQELFNYIISLRCAACSSLLSEVCAAARKYSESITGNIPVVTHLVSYEKTVILSNE